MTSRPRALVAIVVAWGACVGALASERASAYTLYTTCQPDANGQPPANCKPLPLRWFKRPRISYRIGKTKPEEVPADQLAELTQRGFDAWAHTFCDLVPEVTFAGTADVELPTVPRDLRAPPDNVVVFIRDPVAWEQMGNSPSWIAITKISHNSDTGEIVDADILVNDGGYKFTTADVVKADEVDFLSMFTHEAGHFFGLDHSLDPSATMFATYAASASNAKDAATLANDDQVGICTLYTDAPIHIDVPMDDGGCHGGQGGAGALCAAAVCGLASFARRASGCRG